MATASSSKPLRPSEPPFRHSLGVPSSSRLRNSADPTLRSHQATPTRAKLKHAATTPSTSAMSAQNSSPSNEAHACGHCHLLDTRFYCDPCLASRIEAHHTEMRRLSLARDKAKASISALLFDRYDDPASVPERFSVPPSLPIHTINEDELPDPFDTHAAEPMSSLEASHDRLLLYPLIQLRAKRAAILSRVQTVHQCISESHHAHLEGMQILKEKRAQLALRKQNLAKAWSSLEGSSAAASSSASQRSRLAAKSHWLVRPAADHNEVPSTQTDVYTHYERQSDHLGSSAAILSSESDGQQLGATLTRARLHLKALQDEALTVSTELAATRAALARQAFQLFSVSSPDAPTNRSTAMHKSPQVDLSASSSVAQRITRLSERYIPGAFGLGQSNLLSTPPSVRGSNRGEGLPDIRQAKTQATASAMPSSSSNWSIASLPLPLPSEARRYSRETVNGAVTHAVNLLQLVAGYLGVALPFSIEQHKGRFAIRPDPLWDGGGGSSAKTLYIGSSAYTHLTASHSAAANRQSKLNNLAESTYGLGASTLSTIESYIHLPAGTNLPWGLSSPAVPPTKAGSVSPDTDAEAEHSRRSEADSRTPSKSKSEQAAKSFVSALVMFSYNVAYLATKQGVKLDLVAAAANPLDLLTRTLRQAELGRLAHANHIRPSSIQDLSLPSLDYEQLAQILEPNNAAADSYKRGTSKPSKNDSDKKDAARQATARSSKSPAILEQSYIDAGEAAASVLDIKDPSSLVRKPAAQPSVPRTPAQKTEKASRSSVSKSSSRSEAVSSLQKQRVGAGKHGPTTAQPSLDFLRQRGRDATKAKSSASNPETPAATTATPKASPAKVGPGAVIFNGVEVGVGNVSSSDAPRGPGKRPSKQSADEGWDLV